MIDVITNPRALWHRARRSAFLSGVVSLSSGSFIAAALSMLAAPILSRLYSPAEYGILATFMGVAAAFGGIGSWQFEQAVIVEPDDDTAMILVQLCLLASALTATVSLVVVLSIEIFWGNGFHSLRLWFYAIPLLVLAGGFTATLEALANRDQRYSLISRRRILAAVVAVACSVGYGCYLGGVNGLLLGYCAGTLVPTLTYLIALQGRLRGGPRATRKTLIRAAKKHRRFPLFTLPAGYAGNLAMQMPVYALASGGFIAALGQFNRAQQLLTMPLTLLGSSLGQVFKRRAAIDYAQSGTCRTIFLKTGALLLGVGIGPTILLAVFAPTIFEFFLGGRWHDAGVIARVLAPMLFLRLICSPLSATLHVTGSQKIDFLLSVVTLLAVSTFVWLPRYLHSAYMSVVVGFSIAYALVYLAYILVAYKKTTAPQDSRG